MACGKIIVINGASSSGKSSLLSALQRDFEEPYLDCGIDKFIWMLPARYLDRPLWDEVLGLAAEAGPAGHRLFSGMHEALAVLSRTGNNLLVDHVFVEKAWVMQCARLFAELPAYLIGLRCPLNVLEERERSRKDRTLGQARTQHELVHHHVYYDLELDTAELSVEECAERVMSLVNSGISPAAFIRLAKRWGLK